MEASEKEIFERLTANESSIKSLHKRVDKQEELIENIRNIVDEIKYLREDINKLCVRDAAISVLLPLIFKCCFMC